jgi:hypothetical protein
MKKSNLKKGIALKSRITLDSEQDSKLISFRYVIIF